MIWGVKSVNNCAHVDERIPSDVRTRLGLKLREAWIKATKNVTWATVVRWLGARFDFDSSPKSRNLTAAPAISWVLRQTPHMTMDASCDPQ
jgi:hypothetical protein